MPGVAVRTEKTAGGSSGKNETENRPNGTAESALSPPIAAKSANTRNAPALMTTGRARRIPGESSTSGASAADDGAGENRGVGSWASAGPARTSPMATAAERFISSSSLWRS